MASEQLIKNWTR